MIVIGTYRRAVRIERIKEILTKKRRITGEKLASTLGVSLRSVYRDIDFIRAEMSFPVIGTPGDGYQIGIGEKAS